MSTPWKISTLWRPSRLKAKAVAAASALDPTPSRRCSGLTQYPASQRLCSISIRNRETEPATSATPDHHCPAGVSSRRPISAVQAPDLGRCDTFEPWSRVDRVPNPIFRISRRESHRRGICRCPRPENQLTVLVGLGPSQQCHRRNGRQQRPCPGPTARRPTSQARHLRRSPAPSELPPRRLVPRLVEASRRTVLVGLRSPDRPLPGTRPMPHGGFAGMRGPFRKDSP